MFGDKSIGSATEERGLSTLSYGGCSFSLSVLI